jgi:hypothetical protein
MKDSNNERNKFSELIKKILSGAKKPNTFFPFHTLSTALFLSLFFLLFLLSFPLLCVFHILVSSCLSNSQVVFLSVLSCLLFFLPAHITSEQQMELLPLRNDHLIEFGIFTNKIKKMHSHIFGFESIKLIS